MKSLAKLKREPGIWMQDAPIPEIGANDVLIKIKKTAICGTDIHIYKWDEWSQKTIPVPMIIGHEYSGTIAKVGSEVKGLKIGDRVSGEGHISCGLCRPCRAGIRHLCRKNVGVGVTRQGCFAEYLAIPAVNVYQLPDTISDNQAAIFDPMGNASQVALSFSLIGEDVLIIGAGPIGIMAAAIAKHVGARHVVLTDINEYRLDLAKKLNPAIHAINTTKTPIEDVMKKLDMKEGFDVGFEMSGNLSAFNMMLDKTDHTGKVALLGILPLNAGIDWSKIIFKGLLVKGIYGREMFETWYKMAAMIQSGLNINPVITHEFAVDDFQKGFDIMASGNSGKVILNWE